LLLGIALGILIGLLSGVVFGLLMDQARRSAADSAGIFRVVAALLGIPAFWFGGNWLSTSSMLQNVDVAKIRSAYIVCLAIVFTPFVLWELYRRRGGVVPQQPPALPPADA
jgi:hypothetical protein